MNEIVVSDNLTKRFGKITAVDHISFEVYEGEIFGFLGPNGAGKTTTINMLITLLRPDEGTASVCGHDILKEPNKVRERIGVVFQDRTVDGYLSGWDNLKVHGLVYGINNDALENKIRELLKFVELEEWANVLVKYYSGGMTRRLEIARALLNEPEVLFLDEPTLGLDPQARLHIWEYLLDLKRKKKMTIFLTTHYMDEADRLCDRIAIIDHGKIIAMGSPQELKSMISGEIIYVRTNTPMDALLLKQHLEKQGYSAKMLDRDGVVFVNVKRASAEMPVILELAQRAGVKVAEVRYSTPTLDDVFIHLTGRSLRDERIGSFERIREMMRRWRAR
ncbi:MAG: ATP-binding cassette domain-containing protein [Candidatus Baldrarchaeia archaeon]